MMDPPKKKLLITGAGGFIGTHLCETLNTQGIPFEIFSRQSDLWPERLDQLDLSAFLGVIHLAQPKVKQTNSWADLERDCILPIRGLLKAIHKTNPPCLFVFVTSQSAKRDTSSKYGKMKWLAEQLLVESNLNYTILRPGLVFGKGDQGLFNQLRRLIKLSPIVPLIGLGHQQIQPVSLQILVDAIIHVTKSPEQHFRAIYPIAFSPITFKEFLMQLAKLEKKQRLFIPIPAIFINFFLFFLELLPNPPLTRANLAGFLQTDIMCCEETWKKLEIDSKSKGIQNLI